MKVLSYDVSSKIGIEGANWMLLLHCYIIILILSLQPKSTECKSIAKGKEDQAQVFTLRNMTRGFADLNQSKLMRLLALSVEICHMAMNNCSIFVSVDPADHHLQMSLAIPASNLQVQDMLKHNGKTCKTKMFNGVFFYMHGVVSKENK